MELREIEERTREALPQWRDAELDLGVIEKGGSGRTFIRVRSRGDGGSVIAMHYTADRSDNLRFASITDFLNRHEVPAPRILARQEERNLLWVEDLGERDLGNLDGEDWETVRKPAYESALQSVYLLHRITEDEAPDDLPELELSFDEALYFWEHDYFLKQFVARLVSDELAEVLAADASLADLRRELAGLPRSLLHRDFQSTNVMIHDGVTCLIDYQGLRWGVPEYDLASLVYDPYTDFSGEQRESLVGFYHELRCAEGRGIDRESFDRLLHRCATQRLMQALGAYGFLSEVKGKEEFRQHIPVALERLFALSREDGGLPVLAEKLAGPCAKYC